MDNITNEAILKRIKSLTKVDKAVLGLVDAKIVKVKKDRICKNCLGKIKAGDTVITASSLEDKKYHMTFYRAYEDGVTKHYRFVPVRGWMHIKCAYDTLGAIDMHHNINTDWYTKVPFEKIDLNEYEYSTALEILEYAYKTKQISSSEYDDIVNILIEDKTLEDAYNGEF